MALSSCSIKPQTSSFNKSQVALRSRSTSRFSLRALQKEFAWKEVHVDAALLGCPDSETGMCDVKGIRAHDSLLGAPDSVTGLVSGDFEEAAVQFRANRPHAHMVGHHLVHQNPACQPLGCPESETGFCDLSASAEFVDSVQAEREELGEW
eukprot:CAMPEP_0177598258 /NCGR_PEP_ID=MMETSP0419_2-20121207/12232_1 /TAXON_ID=582737 /ORGANISM="Tetraselmis sp., Strain GSL018" /LENGTH=150 /DNA_ID=CAMNT_0019090649 /DNA_START=97 /DNA_END=546 /DNA_ORIENTATION=+